MTTIVDELNRERLERDLTYKALSKGIGVSERTVYRICNLPDQALRDRTAFKIRKYLDTLPRPKPPKAKRRAA